MPSFGGFIEALLQSHGWLNHGQLVIDSDLSRNQGCGTESSNPLIIWWVPQLFYKSHLINITKTPLSLSLTAQEIPEASRALCQVRRPGDEDKIYISQYHTSQI